MTEELKTNRDCAKWFDENIKIYESLAANVANTLKTALDKNNIMYVDVPYRAKTKKSFLKKWEDKDYKDINQVMDLAGIRVITLVESDLDEVEILIKALFNIHENDSGDKSIALGHEKFGYRSRHFICDIGPKREDLIELDHFKGLKFEIQIRTALAHAWAEIEHDRGYKLEGGLPEEYKRRLNIVAAMLEGADNEFNRLTREINAFVDETKKKIARNQLDLEISRVSIQELITNKYSKYVDQERYILQESDNFLRIKNILSELDITTIKKLDELINSTLDNYPLLDTLLLDNKSHTRDTNFILYILMFLDFKTFFEKKILSSEIIGPRTYEILVEYFSKDVVDAALYSANMVVFGGSE